MKTGKTTLISFLVVVLLALPAFTEAQIKYLSNLRQDDGIGYNFFVGDDAEDFGTTIRGFGSGFMFDMFTGRSSIDIVTLGPEILNISLGAGIAISKYRFSENLIIENDAGSIIWGPDTDPTHDYVNSFFGYGKSKLVYGSVYFPAYLNLKMGPLTLSGGAFIDLYLSGKLKRKFLINDDKQDPVLVKNKDFRDYPINKTKYGVSASLVHNNSDIGVHFTYMLTPFFTNGGNPDLNEVRISLSLSRF